MSEKGRKIVARIALAFMILFVASLTAWCFDRTLFHGAIGYCAIFTGFFGIALFVVRISRGLRRKKTGRTDGRSRRRRDGGRRANDEYGAAARR